MTKIDSHDSETALAKQPIEVTDPDRLEARRLAIMHSLGLSRGFFRGRQVLQIGGSAEAALQYSLWGAKTTLVATDPALHDHAEQLFLRHRQPLTIGSQEAVVSDVAQMARFEFVSCEEPLLYSSDPMRDLEILIGNLARDGVLLVGLPEKHVMRRRRLMQQLVRVLSRGADETRKHADSWFGSHVTATAKQRGAPRDAIRDALFLDVRGKEVDLADLCRFFEARELTLLGSDPCWFGAGCHPGKAAFDLRRHRDHFEILAAEWAVTGAVGLEFTRDEPLRIRRERIAHELAALEAIEHRIEQRDVDDALITRLAGSGETHDRLLMLLAKD